MRKVLVRLSLTATAIYKVFTVYPSSAHSGGITPTFPEYLGDSQRPSLPVTKEKLIEWTVAKIGLAVKQ